MNQFFAVLLYVGLLSTSLAYAVVEKTVNEERTVGIFIGSGFYDSMTNRRYELGFAANDFPSDPENRGWFELLLSTGNSSSSGFEAFDQVTEHRFEISSFGRSPKFDNFDWFFGISYFSSEIKIKSKYWNVPSSPKADSIKELSMGLNLGIGSRWRFPNDFFLSVDWIRWAQPLTYFGQSFDKSEFTSDTNDQKTLKETHQKFLYDPRIELLKIKLGYFF